MSTDSVQNTQSSISELIKAIETPDDKDSTKMTKQIRVRKNRKGKLVLMVAKNSKVSKDEVEKLGEYFRDIICPKIIPDYDEKVHGSIDDYNETTIRDENKVNEYLTKQFTPEELDIINKRNLFSKEYLNFSINDIKDFAKLSEDEYSKISDRNLLTMKNAAGNILIGVEIAEFAKLSDAEWQNVINPPRQLLTLKNEKGKIFNGIEIAALAKLTNTEWEKVLDKDLLTKKLKNILPLSGIDIAKLAKLNDDILQNILNRKLFNIKGIYTIEKIIELGEITNDEWDKIKIPLTQNYPFKTSQICKIRIKKDFH